MLCDCSSSNRKPKNNIYIHILSPNNYKLHVVQHTYKFSTQTPSKITPISNSKSI